MEKHFPPPATVQISYRLCRARPCVILQN
ncbi:hypothetical protein ANN_21393, partial [Periplaneta americana]